jgi:hypothetical protein
VDHDISVVWRSYHEPDIIPRGYWDQALLEEFFASPRFHHQTNFDGLDGSGAVVVLNGRTHTADTLQFNDELSQLTWCLVLITGDEEGTFPWREVHHPLMRMWVMSPRRGVHDDLSGRLLPNGYRPQTRELLSAIGQQEKSLDFFYAGQANHDRRTECMNALAGLPNGYVVETEHFGQEKLNYPAYLTAMAQAKVVPCPSGNYCPDTFRVWEALEAGCIPVVDAFSTVYREPGFWDDLLALEGEPFPVVQNWSEFPALLDELTADWVYRSNRVFAWWLDYKNRLRRWIERDVNELWRPLPH